MVIILVENLDKLDTRKTVINTETLTSFDEISENQVENFAYVMKVTEENVRSATQHTERVFLPSTSVMSFDKPIDSYVYFDLESYPFFQKFKKLMEQLQQSKGVLRFRRTMLEENHSLVVSDLFVLSAIFGDFESVHIKQSKRQSGTFHMILLVNFGKGIMSHIEYTVANEERIELELSGIKSIVEFNSDHMKPIQPESKTRLPLSYSVDDIIASARKVDDTMMKNLHAIRELIEGKVSV
jgi:hypothetical protein